MIKLRIEILKKDKRKGCQKINWNVKWKLQKLKN